MPKLYYAVAALAAIAIIFMMFRHHGHAQFRAGQKHAQAVCEVQKRQVKLDAVHDRAEIDIPVKPMSYPDVIKLLADRNELRD